MSTWLVPRQELTVEQIRAVEAGTEEHRLFLGGPGSGKTQVLLHRASYLHKRCGVALDRLHVFVFTNVLRDYLSSATSLLGLPAECVTTLDHWCCEFYEERISKRLPWNHEQKQRDFAAIRHAVLEVLRRHPAESRQFEHVLVDEGQDLDPEAFELLSHLARRLTVCMDHKQQIYDSGSTLDAVRSALGLRRQSLTLLETFRCSPYVVELASQFISDPLERATYLQQTRTAQTDIETPVLYLAREFEDERESLIETTRVRLARGDRVAILLPQRRQVFGFAQGLREAGLAVETPLRPKQEGKGIDFASDLPKILPYHSAKGLTFDSVLLPRVNRGSFTSLGAERVERLLFVGITRATRWVYLSSPDSSLHPSLSKVSRLEKDGCLTVRRPRPPEGGQPHLAASPADPDLDFL